MSLMSKSRPERWYSLANNKGERSVEHPAIPGYSISRPLGKGGMAVVYLATQDSTGRQVALKVMAKHLQADPSFGERFLREARICAELQHPNIVTIRDVGQHESYRYMAMEVLSGGDLKTRMKQGLPIRDSIDIVRGIAAGLDYAHKKNFIHRDIKPENILFRGDGTPVISDFGIARNTDPQSQMTKTGTVIGSPHYMSPEQAEAAQLDSRTDLYSLGVILYEMLTGRVPFKGESAISIGIKHITTPPPPLPSTVAHFQAFIDKALAKDRDERFQTGAELIAALEEAIEGFSEDNAATVVLSGNDAERTIPATQPNDSKHQTAVRPAKKTRAKTTNRVVGLWIAAGLAALALLAGGGWYFLENKSGTLQSLTSPLNAEERQLLAQAELAAEEGRYYSPPGNNAQFYLTALMARNPHSTDAKAAITRLFATYLNEAEQAIAGNNLRRADAFLNQGSQITFYIDDQELLTQLRHLRNEANAARY